MHIFHGDGPLELVDIASFVINIERINESGFVEVDLFPDTGKF